MPESTLAVSRWLTEGKETTVGDVHVPSISVGDTWSRLESDPASVLIDVRTAAEWTYVGLPDLSPLGKKPALVEWQSFPDNRPNSDFVGRLAEALASLRADQGTELFFLCRSGVRSLRAAQAMTAAGYTRCRNVADGFEGPLDAGRHRGTVSGWKAGGLPWVQG